MPVRAAAHTPQPPQDRMHLCVMRGAHRHGAGERVGRVDVVTMDQPLAGAGVVAEEYVNDALGARQRSPTT